MKFTGIISLVISITAVAVSASPNADPIALPVAIAFPDAEVGVAASQFTRSSADERVCTVQKRGCNIVERLAAIRLCGACGLISPKICEKCYKAVGCD
ncbi:hypothetical protein BJ508DRAFT_45097 [Ascobolus immersus RN42]|uniref:Uncharacterized protein n=1 Tax=Ascobolus immersus RN42 TaxID=1160509 RepID=A0A3N4HPQ1_ASCIM|nr:hypothetical protein BJ508DRAFT_45097 [Ascobolus immersus RN42]